VWLPFSHGLAAHSKSCQTFLGFINLVMSRVQAGMSALASAVKTDLWNKKYMCSGSCEAQPAVRCAFASLVMLLYRSGEALASANVGWSLFGSCCAHMRSIT